MCTSLCTRAAYHGASHSAHSIPINLTRPPPSAGSQSPLFEELAAGTDQRWASLGTPCPTWRYEWLPSPCARALMHLLLAALLIPGSQHTRAGAMLHEAAAVLDTQLQACSGGGEHARAVVALRVAVYQARASMLMTGSRLGHAQACLGEAGRLLDAHPAVMSDMRVGLDMLHGAVSAWSLLLLAICCAPRRMVPASGAATHVHTPAPRSCVSTAPVCLIRAREAPGRGPGRRTRALPSSRSGRPRPTRRACSPRTNRGCVLRTGAAAAGCV